MVRHRRKPIGLYPLLLALGALFIAIDLIGAWFPVRIANGAPGQNGMIHRSLSPGQYFEALENKGRETASEYVARTNDTVFHTLVHTDSRQIGFFENWPLWALMHFYPAAGHTQDARRIVRSGGGFCCQAATVLMEACRSKSIPSRLVGLSGHVVAEAKTEEGWRVYDPDYGVALPLSAAMLERSSAEPIIRAVYSNKGYSDRMVEIVVSCYLSAGDNRILPVFSRLSPRLWMVERTTDVLKWLVPIALLIWGLVLARQRGLGRASPPLAAKE